MLNKKGKSKKQHNDNPTPTPFINPELISKLQEFFQEFPGKESEEMLWNMFHLAMVSPDQCIIDSRDLATKFYYYERLKELITGLRKSMK